MRGPTVPLLTVGCLQAWLTCQVKASSTVRPPPLFYHTRLPNLSDLGDVAARNCLVGTGPVAKISNFGLGKTLHGNDYYSSSVRAADLTMAAYLCLLTVVGGAGWCPACALDGSRGCLLWQALNSQRRLELCYLALRALHLRQAAL